MRSKRNESTVESLIGMLSDATLSAQNQIAILQEDVAKQKAKGEDGVDIVRMSTGALQSVKTQLKAALSMVDGVEAINQIHR